MLLKHICIALVTDNESKQIILLNKIMYEMKLECLTDDAFSLKKFFTLKVNLKKNKKKFNFIYFDLYLWKNYCQNWISDKILFR